MEDYYQVIDEGLKGSGELELSRSSQNYLNETRKWATFFAIMLFIGAGLAILFGIIMLIVGSTIGSTMAYSPYGAAGGGMMGVVMIAMSLFYFLPAYYLYQFASKMKTALQRQNSEQLEESFKNLKSHYKLLGILIIVGIGLYIIAIIVFAIVSAASL
jgi:ABC-type dipeptide/oligopeptide/nickel transport system permease component